jgi:predicted GNAT family N-acyltransferase
MLTSVFVITGKDDHKTVLAYYTLSSRELKLDQFPAEIAKKVGKYGYVGVTLLGRMAVTEKYKGTGLGALTLMNALDKSLVACRDVASWAVFVEAIDDDAAAFYSIENMDSSNCLTTGSNSSFQRRRLQNCFRFKK